MSTPAHVILSAVALGRHDWRSYWLAITVGALLPDAAMFVFYDWGRLVADTPEAVIWGTRYHDPVWRFSTPSTRCR